MGNCRPSALQTGARARACIRPASQNLRGRMPSSHLLRTPLGRTHLPVLLVLSVPGGLRSPGFGRRSSVRWWFGVWEDELDQNHGEYPR